MRSILIGICSLLLSACQFSHTPFPEVIKDELVISLQRTACFGSCPDYKVTIYGSGRVVFATRPDLGAEDVAMVHRTFSTDSGVRVPGTHETTIDPKVVDNLLEKFRAVRFFSLRDEYRAEITDNPTYIVAIDTGNGRKAVLDYVGEKAGMPEEVTALQDAIDEAAGTARWVEGTVEVIPLLQKENADFGTVVGLELMDAAAARGDVATMQRLKLLGAPLYMEEGPSPLRTSIYEAKGNATAWLIANGAITETAQWKRALKQAVDSDNHSAFGALYRRPYIELIDRRFATQLLASAASNADPRIVELMLNLGANPDGDTESEYPFDPPLFEAANGILSNDDNHSAADRQAVIRTLLDAKAAIVHCQYGSCDSVLWQVSDPMIAQMLLNAGADANFKDSDGEHILFNISNENVALLLISRGADVNVIRPADGKTLRGWAEYQQWPRVLAILSQSGQ